MPDATNTTCSEQPSLTLDTLEELVKELPEMSPSLPRVELSELVPEDEPRAYLVNLPDLLYMNWLYGSRKLIVCNRAALAPGMEWELSNA